MRDYIVVSLVGVDRPGLLADITQTVADLGVNIVDIGQVSAYRILSLFLLLDTSTTDTKDDDILRLLKEKGEGLALKTIVSRLSELGVHTPKKKEELLTLTVVGPDRPGIVAAITGVLAEHEINIERITMLARDRFFAMELLAGRVEPVDLLALRKELRARGESLGLDVIVQPEDVYRRRKSLIVFDMDSTLVDAEILDEIAQEVGAGDDIAALTAAGMAGELDFETGLRRRVKMLAGTPVATLERIANALTLTPGSEELLLTLKEMGFKTALVTGGFSFFADRLKDRLGIDYVHANELEIQGGKLTGSVIGPVITRERKGELIGELCAAEGIPQDRCIAVGDGANDAVMLENAGLGLAFRGKDLIKDAADGAITKSDLATVLYCLGVPVKKKQ